MAEVCNPVTFNEEKLHYPSSWTTWLAFRSTQNRRPTRPMRKDGSFFAAQWPGVVSVAHDYAKCSISRLEPLLNSPIPELQSLESCTFLRRSKGVWERP
ncbi:Uncharacterized protein DAT39_015378 [Clarias magur]|uniref:Uncharacterized protein n=1 Tax=Clarias magur TaxID=1594786 RepID=A0A8J4TDD0_CLAMG|nr:Uncharacterized protein DAT39_015378 [Clarias magur]